MASENREAPLGTSGEGHEESPADSIHDGKKRFGNFRKDLDSEVEPRNTQLVLICLFFITGMVDSAAYNIFTCFVSMQTGMSSLEVGYAQLTLNRQHSLRRPGCHCATRICPALCLDQIVGGHPLLYVGLILLQHISSHPGTLQKEVTDHIVPISSRHDPCSGDFGHHQGSFAWRGGARGQNSTRQKDCCDIDPIGQLERFGSHIASRVPGRGSGCRKQGFAP